MQPEFETDLDQAIAEWNLGDQCHHEKAIRTLNRLRSAVRRASWDV